MRPLGTPDVRVLPFPPQTTGVDLVVKTVPVPDTGDSVVSGALAPRGLSAAPAAPEGSVVTERGSAVTRAVISSVLAFSRERFQSRDIEWF